MHCSTSITHEIRKAELTPSFTENFNDKTTLTIMLVFKP